MKLRVTRGITIGRNQSSELDSPKKNGNKKKRGTDQWTVRSMVKPPIRRRSGWGEMFFRRKKRFRTSAQGSREKPAGGVSSGKRQSSRMRELSPKAEENVLALRWLFVYNPNINKTWELVWTG